MNYERFLAVLARWGLAALALLLWWTGVGHLTARTTLGQLGGGEPDPGVVALAMLFVSAALVRLCVLPRTATTANRQADPPRAQAGPPLAADARQQTPNPRTARHEAAHAVVALAMGLQVIEVEVAPEGEPEGVCRWSVPGDDPGWTNKRFQHAVVCVSLAGPLVENEHHDTWLGSHFDMSRAQAAAAALVTLNRAPGRYTSTVTIDEVLAEGRRHALAVLEEHAAAVEAFADELAHRGRLAGQDVRTLWHHHLTVQEAA